MTAGGTGTGRIAILFGPPGSGKGTQASFIATSFNLAHVSTGDVLRAQVERHTELGREVEPIMEAGLLVPDDLVVRVIQHRLRDPDSHEGFLLDGFPRTLPQAMALDTMLRNQGMKVDTVISLEVPRDVLKDRLLKRAAEEGRSDDTPETVETRMQVYESETAPVLDYYEHHNGRVLHIDGVGSIEEVQRRIVDAYLGSSDNGAAA